MQGRGQRDAALVRQAQHLEVVHLRQVVAGNLLREGNPDVVADAQNAVRRLRRAEGLRTARVLDAREYVRGVGQVTVAVTTVADGAQVVPLFYGVVLAVEGGIDVAVVLHQFPFTRGQGHQPFALLRVRVVGADVHPVLVALRREFILQFDVVEVAEVHVVAVDVYGQVVALSVAVVGRFGVYHPLVARGGYVHLTGSGHEVCREVHCTDVLHVFYVHDGDTQVFVVILLPGIHLHMLLVDDTRIHPDVATCPCQRHTVDEDFGSLRILAFLGIEVHAVGDALGHLTLIGEVDGEACGLTVGHVADARFLGPDAEFVDLLCGLVEYGAGVVEHRPALLLPRAGRGTGQGAEHEVAVARCAAQSVQIGQGIHPVGLSAVDFRQVVLHILVEEVQSAQFGQPCNAVGAQFASTIDGHRQARLAAACQREACFLRVPGLLAAQVVEVEAHLGCASQTERGAEGVELDRSLAVLVSGLIGVAFERIAHPLECAAAKTGTDTRIGHIAVESFGGGERLAVFHIGAPVEVVGFHEVHGLQFLLLVGSDEARPRPDLAVQHLYGVTPHVLLSLGHESLVVAHAGEVVVVRRHGAAVGGHSRLVGHLLGILGRDRHVEQQGVARLQQGWYQFLQEVTLRVDKGGVDVGRNGQHFVADEIDGILLHGVPAAGQHLGGARHVEVMPAYLHRATHARAQPLHGLAAHGTHGDGILHEDVVRHADVDIGVHAHFLHVVAGGDFLLRLQFVFVTPVGVVFGGQVEVDGCGLVGRRDVTTL